MERYLCIHGHFYQPPRESPWLEVVELQDSAYPYHDWNERVTNECYAPNASSRILDAENRIINIINNYSRISFNFGPPLLQWLHLNRPETYEAILDADRESQRSFSGHGSAIAHVYNHVIVPLANREDKYTQIYWGMRDFEKHFGRTPEGIWLPETAVDLESLDIMAELGIKFTLLAPHQAHAVRKVGEKQWKDVTGGKIDPRMAYLLKLPSGRSICLFFYDAPLSHAVAFENVLVSGEELANRICRIFVESEDRPQLAHIATDGETYGHHYRHGDMALAYALSILEAKKLVRLTNYGEFLERHPPTHEVEIIENTSWSCAHGIERWRSDCGCRTGGEPGWNQVWRGPLREALDYLRDTLFPLFEEKARAFLKNPKQARNEYIQVVLDRSPENIAAFLNDHALRELNEAEKLTTMRLLELQRHTMLMYTSCGWFFSELSGIETVQILQYAGRAVQLAQDLFGNSMEEAFLAKLEQAKSNIPAHRDGRLIYEKFVQPAMVNLIKVGAHYALRSLFEPYHEEEKIYCFFIDHEDHKKIEAGKTKLAVGRVTITSEITGEKETLTYGVLHMGDHNMSGGVRKFISDEKYETMVREVSEAFDRAEFSEMIQLFDKHFGTSTYSLRSLFRDEQRRISDIVLETIYKRAESIQREFYENHLPLMRFFVSIDMPIPRMLYSAAELVINSSLRRALEETPLDIARMSSLLDEAESLGIPMDGAGLGYAMQRAFERDMDEFVKDPANLELLQRMIEAGNLLDKMPFEVDLWRVQNSYFDLWNQHSASYQKKSRSGDETARAWMDGFHALGEVLNMRVT